MADVCVRWSCEPVRQKELEGAVETDVRQRRRLAVEPGGGTRGGRKRTNCSPSRRGVGHAARRAGPPAGRRETRRPRSLPSNTLPPRRSPGIGTPTMHGKQLVADLRFGLARRPQRGERLHIDLGAGVGRAPHGPLGDDAQDRLQPVVARGVNMVGLGGGEQQLVDAAAVQQRDSQCWRRCGTRRSTASSALLQIGERASPPSLSGREHVDQHDLAVEAAEVVAEERAARRASYSSRSGAPSSRARLPRGIALLARRGAAGRRSAAASPRGRPAAGSGRGRSSAARGRPARAAFR